MAMNDPDDAPSGGASDRARIAIALQVIGTVLLFGTAVVLFTWLAERPALRLRFDITAGRENTLDASTLTVLDRLKDDVDIDVFFRPAEFPFQDIARDVQERTERLLVLLEDDAPGRIHVASHDLSDRRGGVSKAEGRMRELALEEVEPGGVVVVSLGKRRAVLHLRGDLADLDPGDPLGRAGPPQPPRLLSFRGEDALTNALLKVSQGDAPKVVFTLGHDERALDDTQPRGLSSLKRDLEIDGFRVESWEGERQGELAADASVLAILGPQKPFTPGEASSVEAFVESGGRLIAAPGLRPLEGEGSLSELLHRWGIRLNQTGLIARPWPQPTGKPIDGIEQCGQIFVWGEGMRLSPITEPLRRADRRMRLPFTRGLERGEVPRGGTLIDLLVSMEDSWRDLPDSQNSMRYSFRIDSGEDRGPFVVAMQEVFPPSRPARVTSASPPGSRPECRLVCLGSADAFCNGAFDDNREFLLNAFNWAASREYRVSVSRKNPQVRRLDVATGKSLSIVNAVAVFLIPGLCLVLGVWTAIKRRR
jgi:hypothetical protein